MEKIEFLVSGKPGDGIKTQDVDDRLKTAVAEKIAQWEDNARGKSGRWASSTNTMKCVDVRIRKLRKQVDWILCTPSQKSKH
jgi:hypothetical protein